MHTVVPGVLEPADLDQLRGQLAAAEFEDGRSTSAHAGKRNLQVPVGSSAATRVGSLVVNRLLASAAFQRAAQPAALHPPLLSRYEAGMRYPDHIDVAVMSGLRTDVAVTVFLSEPHDYEGGELITETGSGARAFKLPAGDALVYPASTVHRIEEVRSGVRLVAVLWVQSLVRSADRRSVLADLATAADALAGSAVGPRLRRAYENLLRQWAEAVPAL